MCVNITHLNTHPNTHPNTMKDKDHIILTILTPSDLEDIRDALNKIQQTSDVFSKIHHVNRIRSTLHLENKGENPL